MAIPETMQAWTYTCGEKEPKRKTVPVPKLKPDHVLIKIEAVGVCHSDCAITAMQQTPPNWDTEFVLGHEGAGTIVQLGPDVKDSTLKVGDRVGVHVMPGCNKDDCPVCSKGLHRVCRTADTGMENTPD
jgi:alcohol dehydrogenase, propanol-preferring